MAVCALPEFRLEAYFSEYEFAVEHMMAASHGENMLLGQLLEMADQEDRAAWESLELGYIETWGKPALREAIAQTFESMGPENTLCFAGAEEGIWCAMNAILQPGDHAIVSVPNYQSMETLPLSICGDGNVSGIALDPRADWAFHLEELKRAVRPNTKLVAVNFPNNPTGAIPPRRTFEQIIELCRERGIAFFSDEIYRGFDRSESLRLPQAADLYENAFSLSGTSKVYGLPGLRVGWIASRNIALLQRMEKLKHYLSICNAGPSEALAIIALKKAKRIIDRNRAICDANLALLEPFFREFEHLYEWRVPAGGCTAFVRYLGADGIEAHCRNLIDRARTLLLPGSIFRSRLAEVPGDRFRIGFGRADMPNGLHAWREYLCNYAN